MAYFFAVVASMIGTILQRVSGTGVALVLAPFLSAFFGPIEGILTTNLINGTSSLLLCMSVIRSIDWRKFILLASFAIGGEILGAIIVGKVPTAWMQLVVGGTVILAMAATWLSGKRLPHVKSPLAAPLTGFIGGILMATAGIGAPATVIYARLVRWDQHSFAATMQPLFSVMAYSAFVIKVKMGVSFAPPWIDAPRLLFFFFCIILAVRMGSRLSMHMTAMRARDLAFMLAAVGAVITTFKGISGLLA